MEWQLIETAPKDGEDILCFCGDYQIVLSWNDFDDDGSSWCTHDFGRYKGWEDYNNEHHTPILWMPLPNPPEEL